MDTYHISGGRRLSGTVNTAGAKNAGLPLLAASIMGSGETVLHNCPALSDVYAKQRAAGRISTGDECESVPEYRKKLFFTRIW